MKLSNQYLTLWVNVLGAVAVATPALIGPLMQALPGAYFQWVAALMTLCNIGLNTWRVQRNALDAAAIAEAPVSDAVKTKAVERIKTR